MAVTQQYWRVYVNGPTNGTSVVALAELAFISSANTVYSTSGATISASSVFSGSFVAANAFDGNPATDWASSANPTSGSPQWIEIEFPSAISVVAMSMTIRNDSGAWTSQSPTAFLIQSSPDGITWTTQSTFTGLTWTSNGQTVVFGVGSTVGNARVSQLAQEAVLNAAPHARVSQLPIEAALNPAPNARVSQLPIETLIGVSAHVHLSQLATETVIPFIPQAAKTIQNMILP